jgi:glycyl-tRNA synthetase (class II)
VGDDKAPADEKVTIRDRDTMQQIRVSMTTLSSVMERLMEAKWAELALQHGIQKD